MLGFGALLGRLGVNNGDINSTPSLIVSTLERANGPHGLPDPGPPAIWPRIFCTMINWAHVSRAAVEQEVKYCSLSKRIFALAQRIKMENYRIGNTVLM